MQKVKVVKPKPKLVVSYYKYLQLKKAFKRLEELVHHDWRILSKELDGHDALIDVLWRKIEELAKSQNK